MADKKILIRPDGEARWIHDDATTELMSALGTPVIRRASHVEQWADLSVHARACVTNHKDNGFSTLSLRHDDGARYGNSWFADLLPVGGPVLGPFDSRDEALTAEVDWLKDKGIPNSDDGWAFNVKRNS